MHSMDLKQILAQEEHEPLLSDESNKRFVVYPIKYHDIWEFFKRAQSAYWQVEEVVLSNDIKDWERLTDNERHFIKHVLAFFAGSDGIVGENLATRFYNDVKIPEARAFYAFQMTIETIHNEMYSLMIDTYIKDTQEKELLFNALDTVPCIKKKGEWAMQWIDNSSMPFAMRLLAFAIVEGVFFSGSFCAIFWLKERNLMPGLCTSNEFISRDEGLHTEFAVMLYNKLQVKIQEEIVQKIMREAVDIETEFITESIPCNMLGMNAGLMALYIQYVADRLLVQLGYNKMYNANNPFAFMNRISLENKTNFFEHRPSDYAKANTGKKNVYEFTLDAAF